MQSELDDIRPKLKEILYDCAVEIHATKAALYLLDPVTRKYDLVTEYGFRTAVRQTAGSNDPMVDRCSRGRSPFYVNSPSMDPRLSDLLFEGATERLMGVPIFSRGLLIGFIDMRDKAQKQPFDQQDVTKAQAVADKILAQFANKNLWNQRFITLSDAQPIPDPQPESAPAPAPQPPTVAPTPPRRAVPPPVAAAPRAPEQQPQRLARLTAAQIVMEARAAVARIGAPLPPDTIGAAEMAAVTESLRSILLLPGAVVASLAATGEAGSVQDVASRGTMTQDALTALQLKLQTWLSKRGESVAVLQTTLHNPLGLTMPPITPAQLQKVFTAAVVAGNFRGLYLTVAFSQAPDRATHELLAPLLNQLQAAIESSLMRSSLQNARLRIAERLLEPEFTAFPDLLRHSANVTEVAEAFAKFLALTPAEAETVKMTAVVHDCGMRLLDYDRLYRKPSLSHEELDLLREHVIVGAAMVEPLLGREVARAVLYHHERVDGAGYPHALRGEDIPLASRVLQICDVYVAITDPATYQTPEPPEAALAAIRRGAGAQFDADLAMRFDEMMRARTAKLAGR